MTDTGATVDGRVARRERNVNAVLDVVLELFGEEALFPSIEQVAIRSGLSLRSLYRYFADPGELLEAAIIHSREHGVDVGRLHSIGQGPLEPRINDFVEMRMQLYGAVGPVYRATVANAARHPRIADELAHTRIAMLEQFQLQFAPELKRRKPAERGALVAAGDVLTQMDSIDFLRRHRGLSVARTATSIRTALNALFGEDL